ncbi:hypothetical protein [Xanthobacter sediminis]
MGKIRRAQVVQGQAIEAMRRALKISRMGERAAGVVSGLLLD